MTISSEIFTHYLICKYRTFLELNEKLVSETSEYEQLQIELDKRYKENVLEKIFAHTITLNKRSLNVDGLKQGIDTFTNVPIFYKNLSANINALEKIHGKSSLGVFHYIPYQFNKSNKITKNTKLLLAFNSYVLGMIQGNLPDYGKIIYGDAFKIKKIKIKDYLPQVKNILEELNNLLTSSETNIYS